jgi:hypothetical protein
MFHRERVDKVKKKKNWKISFAFVTIALYIWRGTVANSKNIIALES